MPEPVLRTWSISASASVCQRLTFPTWVSSPAFLERVFRGLLLEVGHHPHGNRDCKNRGR